MANLSVGGQLPAHSRSERDLTKVTKVRVRTTDDNGTASGNNNTTYIKQRTKMKTTTLIVNEDNTKPSTDVVRSPLNWQLAEQTAAALRAASDDLVRLYKRISLDHDLEEETRSDFLRRLAGAAGAAQHTLRPVATPTNNAAIVHVTSSSSGATAAASVSPPQR